ncbi:MAG: hypothetical protein WAV46_03855 [Candidatus Moraniibacteriota bacterium]
MALGTKDSPLEIFPSDTLLALLTESDILHGRISMRQARERNPQDHRSSIRATILDAVRAEMHLIECDEAGAYHRPLLSEEGGALSFRFAFKVLIRLGAHPRFEDNICVQLYEELKPIALNQSIFSCQSRLILDERNQLSVQSRHRVQALTA